MTVNVIPLRWVCKSSLFWPNGALTVSDVFLARVEVCTQKMIHFFFLQLFRSFEIALLNYKTNTSSGQLCYAFCVKGKMYVPFG